MATAFVAMKIKNKQASSSKLKKNESPKDKQNIECFYCKKGHYKADCRLRIAKQKESSEEKNHQALCIETKNLSDTNDKCDWLADSAASKHMSHREEWFIEIKKSKNEGTVQIGSLKDMTDNGSLYQTLK